MGELLSFPSKRSPSTRSDSTEEPAEEPQGSGAGRRSVPTRRPGLPLSAPAMPIPVDDGGLLDDDVAEQPAQDEPGWAVPGVDDAVRESHEPTRTSRRAENVAMATLTRHDASEGEVRAKLVAKGLDDDDVEAELERLRRVGLIDDAAFAVRVVERLRDRKGLGDSAIRSTLRGRLVPPAIVDAVLADQVEDQETAEARLQEVANDRARRLTSLPYPVAERRLMAYLMRKGFGGSAVRAAARAALDGAGIR